MALELPTYSAVFAFEKRLYAIYDVELPTSISLFQGVVFLVAVGIDVLLTGLFGIGLSPRSFWVFVVPPAGAAWLASQPLADHKRPHQWIGTRLRHWREPHALVRLHPDRTGRLLGWPPRRSTEESARRCRVRTPILVPADRLDGTPSEETS